MAVYQVDEYYVYISFVKLGYTLTKDDDEALQFYINDKWGDDFEIDDLGITVDGFDSEFEAENCEVQLTNLIKGSMV